MLTFRNKGATKKRHAEHDTPTNTKTTPNLWITFYIGERKHPQMGCLHVALCVWCIAPPCCVLVTVWYVGFAGFVCVGLWVWFGGVGWGGGCKCVRGQPRDV